MELQEFIKETLVQITQGVIDAQQEMKANGCLINPLLTSSKGDYINDEFLSNIRSVQKVKMNIALTISESSGKKSGIGVAKVLNAGINSEHEALNEKVTSISFEIPIALPVAESKNE